MNQQKGSVLIMALWAVSFLAVITAGFTLPLSTGAALMKREAEVMRAKAGFLNGLRAVQEKILTDPFPHEDSPGDDWLMPFNLPLDESNEMQISVVDEGGKLNLNNASENWIRAFLEIYEDEHGSLEMKPDKITKALVKARDKKSFRSPAQLYLVEGLDPRDVERLLPFFTVYPDTPLFNANTMNPLVLRALIRSYSGDEFAK